MEVRDMKMVYGFAANAAFVAALIFATVWAVWATGSGPAVRAQLRSLRPGFSRPAKATQSAPHTVVLPEENKLPASRVNLS